MCSVADTEAKHCQDLVRRLPHSTFLDLTTRPDVPDDVWEDGVPHLNQQSSSSTLCPQQPRPVPNRRHTMVPPSLPEQPEDDMTIHDSETQNPEDSESHATGTSDVELPHVPTSHQHISISVNLPFSWAEPLLCACPRKPPATFLSLGQRSSYELFLRTAGKKYSAMRRSRSGQQ